MENLKVEMLQVGPKEVLSMMRQENLRPLYDLDFRYHEGEGTKADIFVDSSGEYKYVYHRKILYSVTPGYDKEIIDLFIKM